MIHGFLPEGLAINIQGENGILGIGPYPKPGQEDADLLNAGNVNNPIPIIIYFLPI